MHLLRSVAFGLVLLCPGALALSLSACADKTSQDDFQASQSPDAIHGRTTARGMMGLSETPETATGALAQHAADYEAVAAHMLVVIEKQEPGVFDRFGVELASRDGKRATAAWVGMRQKIDALADSAPLMDEVRRDPSFQGASIQAVSSGLTLTDYQPPQDGIPNLGRGPDGVFGDGKTGAAQAAADLAGLAADPFTPWTTLGKIDSGELVPDAGSRLGAYKCTAGYGPGTVGRAVHRAIGTIYIALGTYGEERIGRVFCDPQAMALFKDPVTSDSSVKIAQIEQRYWDNARNEDGFSLGGRLGAAFSPSVRNFLQRHIFRSGTTPTTPAPTTNPPSGNPSGDAGSDAPVVATDCSDKSDGWYCFDFGSDTGWMVYCQAQGITSGCPCGACKGAKSGTTASCSSALPPAACTSN